MHPGTKVLVRRKQLTRDVRLVKADVLSQTGDTVRVKIEGVAKPEEVKASDLILASKVFGTRPGSGVVPKSYPGSMNALGNTLNR